MQRFEMAADPRDPPGLRWLETLIPGVYFLSGFGSLITFTSTVGIVSAPSSFLSSRLSHKDCDNFCKPLLLWV
ncbi:MAG: hypothetical protein CMP47_14500 [Rickettsiales bacterium]|nr:hypothetical protein [Rickettsiales bacterium]